MYVLWLQFSIYFFSYFGVHISNLEFVCETTTYYDIGNVCRERGLKKTHIVSLVYKDMCCVMYSNRDREHI